MSDDFCSRAVDRVTRARAAHPDPARSGSDRVPPGQHLVPGFPVLHYGSVPRFDPARWDFRVSGLVANPLTLSWAEFGKLPTKRQVCDIHCVTTWSKLDTVWEGVPFTHTAELVQPKPEARYVVALCEHNFTTSLPLGVLMDEDVLLATRYDDQPLAPEHGAPPSSPRAQEVLLTGSSGDARIPRERHTSLLSPRHAHFDSAENYVVLPTF